MYIHIIIYNVANYGGPGHGERHVERARPHRTGGVRPNLPTNIVPTNIA